MSAIKFIDLGISKISVKNSISLMNVKSINFLYSYLNNKNFDILKSLQYIPSLFVSKTIQTQNMDGDIKEAKIEQVIDTKSDNFIPYNITSNHQESASLQVKTNSNVEQASYEEFLIKNHREITADAALPELVFEKAIVEEFTEYNLIQNHFDITKGVELPEAITEVIEPNLLRNERCRQHTSETEFFG
jgi:hypothetical protein